MKNIKNYLFESSNQVKHDDLGDRGLFYTNNGELTYFEECVLYPVKTKNCIEITLLHSREKSKGTGTSLMNEIIKFANSKNKCIIVYADPLNDDISKENLIKFYMKFGFVQDERTNDEHCLIYKK